MITWLPLLLSYNFNFKTTNTLLNAYDYIVVGTGAAATGFAVTLGHHYRHKSILMIEAGDRSNNYENSSPSDRSYGKMEQIRVFGGGATYNGKRCRGLAKWYIEEEMGLKGNDSLALQYASAWSFDTYCSSSAQSSLNTGSIMTSDVNLIFPTTNIEDFKNKAGYCTQCVKTQPGQYRDQFLQLVSANDVPGYSFFNPRSNYLFLEHRNSPQTLLESYPLRNIHFLLKQTVKTIEWGNGLTATGVTLVDGMRIALKPNGELILAASVYETPMLLQRSGYGPDTLLKQLNIQPINVSAEHREMIGKNYWNPVYFARGGPFGRDFRSKAQIDGVPLPVSDGLFRTFSRDDMYRDGTWISVGGSPIAGTGDPECFSRSFPTGTIEQRDNMIPFQYVMEKQDPRDIDMIQFRRTAIDCAQLYFMKSLYPIYRNKCSKCTFENLLRWYLDGFPQASSDVDSILNRLGGREPPNFGQGVGYDAEFGPRWSSYPGILAKADAIPFIDAIHYGGTVPIGSVVTAEDCKLKGVSAVRVVDLSLLQYPSQGNTWIQASAMGRYCAKHGILKKDDFDAASERSWRYEFPVTHTSDNENLLYGPDGTSVTDLSLGRAFQESMLKWSWHASDYLVYHDTSSWSMCIIPERSPATTYVWYSNTVDITQSFFQFSTNATSDIVFVIGDQNNRNIRKVELNNHVNQSWYEFAVGFEGTNTLNVFLNGELVRTVDWTLSTNNLKVGFMVAERETCVRHMRVTSTLNDAYKSPPSPPPTPPSPPPLAECLITPTQYKSFGKYGTFELTDIVSLLRYLLNKPMIGDKGIDIKRDIENCADFNRDTRIDLIDLISFLQYLLGKISPLTL